MSRDILNDIIANFETEKFINFFRSKTPDFAPSQERLPRYNDSDFANFKKLGEIGFLNSEQRLIIVSAEVAKSLTERSGKKAQYEKAKKILRELDRYETGIFIFHDKTGSFRFSLVYEQTLGTKRAFSNFRRFTYFVDVSQTNKTFLKQVGDGDFSSLEKIKERFSVEKVTKDFYREISNWYFWAIKNVVFPKDAEKDRNKRNSFAVIRLITRIIFIWFMKEKGLMPAYLFNKEKVKGFLRDLSKNESSYYKAILQNLFFATLNTPINKRGFREEKDFHGRNKDFMNHHIYRYEKYFKDSDYILKLFKGIPFLNGGLFECLDKPMKKEGKNNHIRIDGFSDRKDNSLKIPNSLFFSDELEVDLNRDYGTKTKKYKTRGLINILKSYNFTIDENTPIDEEIALDPELLGRVFENLLASYNPETSTTARKATGSYYTPRMIVDYMVNESLKAYFKNRLTEVKNIDKKLTDLLSYSEDNHRFNNSEVNILIEAINELKIIDPAVGSGAFPMGILQKLVFVLSKLDPHNTKWKQKQIKAVEKNIPDDVLKRDLIEKIEANFKNNELDYGRKLYLIQNCIYGVDIQPIAIQICKLRFFISLLVDEKSNDNEKKNFGIEPLPNLETKFVSANSLIGLKKMGQLLLPTSDVIALEKELNEIRRKHFTASRIKEKENLRKKDAETREKLTKLLEGSIFSSETTAKLASWDPYNPNASADFFDSEWMFGIKDGFDIVIANPPYITYKGKQKVKVNGSEVEAYLRVYKNSAQYKINSFALFLEKGTQLLKREATLSFIIPSTFLQNQYLAKIRKHLLSNFYLHQIVVFTSKVFAAVTDSIILFVKNDSGEDKETGVIKKKNLEFIHDGEERKLNYPQSAWNVTDEGVINLKITKEESGILSRIEEGSEPLDEYFEVKIGIKRANAPIESKVQENYKKFLLGRDIQKYIINFSNKYILFKKSLFHTTIDESIFLQPEKLLVRKTGNVLLAAYDDKQFYVDQSIYNLYLKNPVDLSLKYILALINSTLMNFYFKKKVVTNPDIYPYIKGIHLKKIPIKTIPLEEQKPFVEIVDKVLTQNRDSGALEEYNSQIDKLVYKLYGLTPEEIEIMEKS